MGAAVGTVASPEARAGCIHGASRRAEVSGARSLPSPAPVLRRTAFLRRRRKGPGRPGSLRHAGPGAGSPAPPDRRPVGSRVRPARSRAGSQAAARPWT